MDYTKQAELLKVMGHPVRLKIIAGLLSESDCCVKHIWECLGMPQTTVSQHLSLLKRAGILKSFREGTRMRYRVADKQVTEIIKILGGN